MEPRPLIRRARVSGFVASVMTALIFMIGAVVCAWIFHVLPGIDRHHTLHHSAVQHRGGNHKLDDNLTIVSDSTASSGSKDSQQAAEQQQQSSVVNGQAAGATGTITEPSKEPWIPAHDFCPPLSSSLLQQHAKRNMVLLTFAAFDTFKEFGQTFQSHLKTAGITYGIMGVPDLRTARLVATSQVPCFTMPGATNATQETTALHSPRSKQLSWLKVAAARAVHALGIHIIQSDLNVVWLRDPMAYFLDTHTLPDFVISLDPSLTANPLGDEGLEAGVSLGHYINTGLYFLRAGLGGSVLMDTWHQLGGNETYMRQRSDQEGLLAHLQGQKATSEVDAQRRVVKMYGGRTIVAQLAPSMFQGGYSRSINKLHELHRVQPYAVHMTWVYGGDYGQMHRLRELQFMDDPPEYYEEGLYLTVGMTRVETPDGFNGWTDSFLMAEHHWKVMQQQLRDLYYALAIAYCADRILILPKLTCHCIHNWFETQQCRLPGDKITQLPFTCPADYVFNMEKLSTLLITSRRVPFREHNWLENPRTAAKYKAKPFLIEAGDVSNPVHETTRHVLPTKYHDFELVGELGRLKQHPIIHVHNPERLFKGFTHAHIQQEFDKKVGELANTWCCLPDTVVKERNLATNKFPLKVLP